MLKLLTNRAIILKYTAMTSKNRWCVQMYYGVCTLNVSLFTPHNTCYRFSFQ